MIDDITRLIRTQVHMNRDANLLYRHCPDNMLIHSNLASRLKRNALFSDDGLRRLVAFASRQTVDVLYRHNQFLQISSELRGTLTQIYMETLEQALTGCSGYDVIRRHQFELSNWVRDLYPRRYIDVLEDHTVIGSAHCAEYSPAMIEKIYRIDLYDLKEPILDIGCGTQQQLVAGLQKLGKYVYGFDRCIGGPSDSAGTGDWLTFRFEPETWSSIIANMSFSNHFIHHLAEKTRFISQYQSAYTAICKSLKIGGTFYYSPSLPADIESLRPDGFHISRHESFGVSVSVVTRSA